jgi:hypothetical protein
MSKPRVTFKMQRIAEDDWQILADYPGAETWLVRPGWQAFSTNVRGASGSGPNVPSKCKRSMQLGDDVRFTLESGR